ncbi:kynurenine formamidase [Elysia marginata]|uniref:Kynurenine formamidase n=1 Tax=Elysia marginata TaxID=1093978 RepID=A0AAV4GND4_9GAST|nr:kynurenine formamidase [Elysia marginata]
MSALNRARDGLGDSSGSSESFAVVSENGALGGSEGGSSLMEASAVSEGFVSMESSSTERDDAQPSDHSDREGNEVAGPAQDATENRDEAAPPVHENVGQEGENNESQSASHSGSLGDDEEEPDEDSGDNDSVITVRPKDIDRHTMLVNLCKSVKAFIGLAGVYSISDHFKHEFQRGVEDMSIMCRAHYGEDHFYRFSPREIVHSLGRCLRYTVWT